MKQIIPTRTYKAMYRLLDRVSPIDGDCGRLCGSICCTIEEHLTAGPECPNSSDDIFLHYVADVNESDPHNLLETAPANDDNPPEEEQVLGIYLYPGEESLFLPGNVPAPHRTDDPATLFCMSDGTPLFSFEAEDALDYDYPDSWTGNVWFARCLCASHCERAMRPLQCRFYPACPHIDRHGQLTLIRFPGAAAGAESIPYQCPLIEQQIPLNPDFLKATYTVCRHLLRDPQIYDLFLFDSAWRREAPDFDEDAQRLYPL